MAFNSAPGRAEYTAIAGQTIFPFVFKIYTDEDVKVYLTPKGQTPDDVADLLILATDYTVSINGDNGGEITLTSGASLDDSITLVRSLDIDRLIEYQDNGDLLAVTLNGDQDYQTYLIADQEANSDRTLKLPSSVQGVSTELPAPEALKLMRWNSTETALENVSIGDDDVFINVLNVDSIADLLLVDILSYETVNVRGYYAPSDGGGGVFNYDISQAATNNGGTIINGWVRQYSGEVYVEWFGAIGDGVTNDSTAFQAALDASLNVSCISNKVYAIQEELSTPDGSMFDLAGSTLIAHPSMNNTSNVIKVAAANVIVKNGKINGNRANLLDQSARSGIYGCGVLVADGAGNVEINNIETFECFTNGQLAVASTGSISDVKFINYNSHDNAWTGTGCEAQVNGSPILYAQFINGSTYNNELGGDIRIQGADTFLVDGHIGAGGDHGAANIGVGEAKNVTRGSIVNSFLGNSNAGLQTCVIDGIVGGTGPFAGQLEQIEVYLDNNIFEGAGTGTGLNIKNSALVTGGTNTIRKHTNNLLVESDSLVIFDQLVSQESVSAGLDLRAQTDIDNLVVEFWGAAVNAVTLRTGSEFSRIRGRLGAISGETGKDGIAQVGSPADIEVDIVTFTGSGTAVGLVPGSVANTWKISDIGAENMLELIDGIVTPATEAGRAKFYIDIGDGNLKLLKGDGAITTFDPIVTTTAELEDVTSAINTDGRKTKGLYVHNDTTNKAIFANSSLANDVWLDANGVITHTPV